MESPNSVEELTGLNLEMVAAALDGLSTVVAWMNSKQTDVQKTVVKPMAGHWMKLEVPIGPSGSDRI